jgi:hypothetical protein
MGVPQDDGICVGGACAVQTAVPLIRVSKAFREEENHLAGIEAEEIEALRLRTGIVGEEVFLPYAFIRSLEIEDAVVGSRSNSIGSMATAT